jgi:membrane protein implicated in regulation of membrane protease activity
MFLKVVFLWFFAMILMVPLGSLVAYGLLHWGILIPAVFVWIWVGYRIIEPETQTKKEA